MAVRAESPDLQDPPISNLQEAVLGLLEDAGIDTATNDRIVNIIYEAERHMANETYLEPEERDSLIKKLQAFRTLMGDEAILTAKHATVPLGWRSVETIIAALERR